MSEEKNKKSAPETADGKIEALASEILEKGFNADFIKLGYQARARVADYMKKQAEEKIAPLNEQIKALSVQIQSLQDQKNKLSSKISSMESEVDNIKYRMFEKEGDPTNMRLAGGLNKIFDKKEIEEVYGSDLENKDLMFDIIRVPKEGPGMVLLRSKEDPEVALLVWSQVLKGNDYEDRDDSPSDVYLRAQAQDGKYRGIVDFKVVAACKEMTGVSSFDRLPPDWNSKKEALKKSLQEVCSSNGIKFVGVACINRVEEFMGKFDGVQFGLVQTNGEFRKVQAEQIKKAIEEDAKKAKEGGQDDEG